MSKVHGSKWKVASTELPSQLATKRRQVFKLVEWRDVWTFLRTVRVLAKPRSLGNPQLNVRKRKAAG